MKNRKKYLHLFAVLMGLLMLFGTGLTVSASSKMDAEVIIKGVQYRLYTDPYADTKHTAIAFIENVRGDHLPTELYITRKEKYQNKKYKVESYWWRDPAPDRAKYMDWKPVNDDMIWKQNIFIPDKARSYQACLKKITIAKGVEVWGEAYGYEQLRQVILEDPNDLKQALFNNCPKLKRLHIPAGMRNEYAYDIKNCPSLKVTVDKKNKRLKMVGNDITSKNGRVLLNVTAGKKNYKVPKGIVGMREASLWGNTAIEKIHLGNASVSGICGLPNLKSIKVNKKKNDNANKYFYWNSIAYCPSLRRIEIPETVRYVYTYDFVLSTNRNDPACFSPIKHVYLYSTNLKGGGDLEDIPADTTFHVRNKKVSKKLRKFGFRGKIVIEKNMK